MKKLILMTAFIASPALSLDYTDIGSATGAIAYSSGCKSVGLMSEDVFESLRSKAVRIPIFATMQGFTWDEMRPHLEQGKIAGEESFKEDGFAERLDHCSNLSDWASS